MSNVLLALFCLIISYLLTCVLSMLMGRHINKLNDGETYKSEAFEMHLCFLPFVNIFITGITLCAEFLDKLNIFGKIDNYFKKIKNWYYRRS